jgi:hypothetical protein
MLRVSEREAFDAIDVATDFEMTVECLLLPKGD